MLMGMFEGMRSVRNNISFQCPVNLGIMQIYI